MLGWMCLEEAVMEGEALTLVRYTVSVHMLNYDCLFSISCVVHA